MAQVGTSPPAIPNPGAAGLALVKSSTSTPTWATLTSSTGCAPILVSNRWYCNAAGPGITAYGASSTLVLSKAVIYAPIYTSTSIEVSGLGGIFVGGTIASGIRLGVYSSDSSGAPASVLFQSATFTVAASSSVVNGYTAAVTGSIPAGLSYIAIGNNQTNGAAAGAQLAGVYRYVPLRGGTPSATAPSSAQSTGYIDVTGAFAGTLVDVVAVKPTTGPQATVYYRVA